MTSNADKSTDNRDPHSLADRSSDDARPVDVQVPADPTRSKKPAAESVARKIGKVADDGRADIYPLF